MNNKILCYLLLLVLILTECSCSNNTNQTNEIIKTYIINNKEVSEEEYNSIINNLDKPSTEEIIENNSPTIPIKDTQLNKEDNIIEIYPEEVYILSNEKDKIELTLNYKSLQDEIYGLKEQKYVKTYLSDIENETYLILSVTIKNIGSDSISDSIFDDIILTVTDRYNYNMQQIDPNDSILSQFWVLEPLKTKEIWFIKSIPDEFVGKVPNDNYMFRSFNLDISLKNGNTIYRYSEKH